MGRLIWSLVFLSVPIFGVGTFIAGWYYDHWLPEDLSVHGRTIDHLFMFILVLTGIVFVATEGVLFWFLWKYHSETGAEPVKFTHGSHSLEVVWTIVPAATLLFIALYQMDSWAANKMRKPSIPITAEVVGRQFEWRFRYPGPDGRLHTEDDIHDVNELHLPAGEEVLLAIKSEDVLHAFFLPNLRVKQDVVPGMTQYVWFKAKKPAITDIVCAELCGWGHYKMKGRLVLQSREDYEEFLRQKAAEQNATTEEE